MVVICVGKVRQRLGIHGRESCWSSISGGRFVASAVACTFSCLVFAGPPDLADVHRAAELGDPVLQSARHALEIARQKWPEARAGLLPVVSLSGNLNSTESATQFSGSPVIDRDAAARSWTLQLTQPLFRVGNVLADQQAQFIVFGAEAQFEQARQDLIVRVAQAYFAVNEAQDAIAAADAQIEALEEQLAQVTQSMKLGTKSMTDVDDTRTRLGSAEAQRVAARNDLENVCVDLQKITGSRYMSLAALRTDAVLPAPEPREAASWAERARMTNPAVRAQAAALEAAQLDVRRVQAQHLPTVDLVVSSTHDYSSHSLTTPGDFSTHGLQHQVGVQINVPLFAGGAVIARVAQAQANVDKVEDDLEAARRGAGADARHAFSGVVTGLAQVEALLIAVESGRHALQGNLAGFRVGVRTNLDVLNAQQQLYAAQRDLSKARYEALLQGLKLKDAAGTLDEQDVAALSLLFH